MNPQLFSRWRPRTTGGRGGSQHAEITSSERLSTQPCGLDTAAAPLPIARDQQSAAIQPVMRMCIDAIGLDEVVFAHSDDTTLRRGPGHVAPSPMPGEPGNAVVVGHRDNWSAPFRRLDRTRIGHLIDVSYSESVRYRFTIDRIAIAHETTCRIGEQQHRGAATLTLLTAHPRHPSAWRLVVEAVADPSWQLPR